MTPRARRALFAVVVFFTVCAVAGTVLERRVGAQSSQDESQLRDSFKSFTDVYAIVEQNYAEPITPDKADDLIYDGAIPGMLQVLDPHSHFYDPKSYARLREDQRGHYYGVGMVIQQQNDNNGKSNVYVVTPYEDTPSFRAGIHPGDEVVAVDGKSTDGWTSDQVAKALKGPKGTHVQVTMVRFGQAKPLVFDLVRDEIPHPSIDLKFEIRPGIGYIHLTQFQETTGQEMNDAIDSFGDLKGLVLDLRENPGGLLSQAVDVCDHLLAKGQTIVSQRGRAYSDQNYVATHGNDGKTFPIVVLVNRDTASAAEIVSGALQDHDRALIVGETTFGKGLVQTVYNLSEDSGLALTTYHYYTPSGRLIQRNYAGVSLYDYYNHAGAGPSPRLYQPRSQADRLGPHRLWRRRHHARRKNRAAHHQPLPGRAGLQRRLLPLCAGLRGHPYRRQELPGRRRCSRRLQEIPHQPGRRLDRRRHQWRLRLGEGADQEGHFHHSIRPAHRTCA